MVLEMEMLAVAALRCRRMDVILLGYCSPHLYIEAVDKLGVSEVL
jgi:hypothetical protein